MQDQSIPMDTFTVTVVDITHASQWTIIPMIAALAIAVGLALYELIKSELERE